MTWWCETLAGPKQLQLAVCLFAEKVKSELGPTRDDVARHFPKRQPAF
jgi:hypothetical protein